VTLSGGSRLGPYEILGQIGAGGMGEVYRAKDPRLGREVAIKVLPASFSQDDDRLRRFALSDQPIENGNHMASSQAASSLNGKTFAGEVIDDVEHTKTSAVSQGVRHEIH